jgi:hypothetical protein
VRFIANNAEVARFNNTSGNLLIGTTTDAGFKLDVNGTARVSNSLSVLPGASGGSFGITSRSYTPLICEYVNSGNVFFTAGLNTDNTAVRISSGGMSPSYRILRVFADSNDEVRINSTNSGATSQDKTALLELVSIKAGFLPPRMTTTQKNAIATPAAGLQIYDSTLNRPCFYDGTTWITL